MITKTVTTGKKECSHTKCVEFWEIRRKYLSRCTVFERIGDLGAIDDFWCYVNLTLAALGLLSRSDVLRTPPLADPLHCRSFQLFD
jgi:hypothetical protein